MDWIDWEGGSQPLHGNEYVVVKFRSGITSGVLPSKMLQWEHGYRGVYPHPADVISYAIVDAYSGDK